MLCVSTYIQLYMVVQIIELEKSVDESMEPEDIAQQKGELVDALVETFHKFSIVQTNNQMSRTKMFISQFTNF